MPVFTPAQIAAAAQNVVPAQPPQPTTAAPSPSAPSPKWPYGLLLAGQGADAATTLAALAHPNLQELNPMGEWGTLATKAGVTAGLMMLMHHAHSKGDDHAVKVIGTIGGLLGLGPAVWNMTQIAKANGESK